MSKEKKHTGPLKRWLITLGLFVSGQLIFILIDGTILEPRVNNIGSFVTNIIEGKFEWFTLYHSPFLKFLSLLFVVFMVGTGVKDIVVYVFKDR